jgi:hypothetical protein
MSKLIKAFFLTTILSVCVFAQSGSGEYKRNEFYGGYSNQQVDNFDRQTFNGFEAAYVRNIRRYVGIKGDFSAAYRRDDFSSSRTCRFRHFARHNSRRKQQVAL